MKHLLPLILLLLIEGASIAGIADAVPVRIGSGPKIVIEVTDPDCPYCRQCAAFLYSRTDVTQYIYFNPLQMHPEAGAKAAYILCSQNQERAYVEVYSGRFDKEQPAIPSTCYAEGLLESHSQVVFKAGVDVTPTLWIAGVRVDGCDLEQINALLRR